MHRLKAGVLSCAVVVFSFAPYLIAETSSHATTEEHAPSAEEVWTNLAAGNQRYVAGESVSHDLVSRRQALVKTQHPPVAVLSCSDSRVPPEIVFDQALGDIFVVRSAGNSADPLGIGSLEYAVEHLGTGMIVVLGHQSCGAVKAACAGGKAESPNLAAVVEPVLASCAAAQQTKKIGDDLIAWAVRDHVHVTAQALLEKSVILKHAAEEGKLTIVEAYYSLQSGKVTRPQ